MYVVELRGYFVTDDKERARAERRFRHAMHHQLVDAATVASLYRVWLRTYRHEDPRSISASDWARAIKFRDAVHAARYYAIKFLDEGELAYFDIRLE